MKNQETKAPTDILAFLPYNLASIWALVWSAAREEDYEECFGLIDSALSFIDPEKDHRRFLRDQKIKIEFVSPAILESRVRTEVSQYYGHWKEVFNCIFQAYLRPLDLDRVTFLSNHLTIIHADLAMATDKSE